MQERRQEPRPEHPSYEEAAERARSVPDEGADGQGAREAADPGDRQSERAEK